MPSRELIALNGKHPTKPFVVVLDSDDSDDGQPNSTASRPRKKVKQGQDRLAIPTLRTPGSAQTPLTDVDLLAKDEQDGGVSPATESEAEVEAPTLHQAYSPNPTITRLYQQLGATAYLHFHEALACLTTNEADEAEVIDIDAASEDEEVTRPDEDSCYARLYQALRRPGARAQLDTEILHWQQDAKILPAQRQRIALLYNTIRDVCEADEKSHRFDPLAPPRAPTSSSILDDQYQSQPLATTVPLDVCTFFSTNQSPGKAFPPPEKLRRPRTLQTLASYRWTATSLSQRSPHRDDFIIVCTALFDPQRWVTVAKDIQLLVTSTRVSSATKTMMSTFYHILCKIREAAHPHALLDRTELRELRASKQWHAHIQGLSRLRILDVNGRERTPLKDTSWLNDKWMTCCFGGIQAQLLQEGHGARAYFIPNSTYMQRALYKHFIREPSPPDQPSPPLVVGYLSKARNHWLAAAIQRTRNEARELEYTAKVFDSLVYATAELQVAGHDSLIQQIDDAWRAIWLLHDDSPISAPPLRITVEWTAQRDLSSCALLVGFFADKECFKSQQDPSIKQRIATQSPAELRADAAQRLQGRLRNYNLTDSALRGVRKLPQLPRRTEMTVPTARDRA